MKSGSSIYYKKEIIRQCSLMCGDIDVMLSEEDGYCTVIEVNELALSGSLTPFHFPKSTHVYVLFLPAVLRKQS